MHHIYDLIKLVSARLEFFPGSRDRHHLHRRQVFASVSGHDLEPYFTLGHNLARRAVARYAARNATTQTIAAVFTITTASHSLINGVCTTSTTSNVRLSPASSFSPTRGISFASSVFKCSRPRCVATSRRILNVGMVRVFCVLSGLS